MTMFPDLLSKALPRVFLAARMSTTGRAAALCLWAALVLPPAAAQDAFDPDWYDPDPTRPYVKIAVVADGVYRVTGADLDAAGIDLADIDPASLRLYADGRQVPIDLRVPNATFSADAAFRFVGLRNTGADEAWAYNDKPGLQPSTFYSLYTDTTTYWLTWGGAEAPLRYAEMSPAGAARPVAAPFDVVHFEQSNSYFDGEGIIDSSNPLYTRGEGWHTQLIPHWGTPGTVRYPFEISAPGLRRDTGGNLEVSARLTAQTNAPHKVILEVELTSGEGAPRYTPLDSVEWSGYGFADLRAVFSRDRLPADHGVRVRIVSRDDPERNPNAAIANTYLTYIEVAGERVPTLVDGQVSFAANAADAQQFSIAGPDPAATLDVYAPDLGFRYSAPGGRFVADPEPGTRFYAVAPNRTRTPARISRDRKTDWASTSHAADYLILTTAALRGSAEQMAGYRRSPAGGGHAVLVVDIADVFDQFDYGRARSIAVRRFLRRTRSWDRPPAFLLLWGDALYPDRNQPRAPWELLSFGHSSSDGWFSMQFDGPVDWTEALHTGRITARSNEDGLRFLQKVQNYEAQPPAGWQKKVLILAGGANASQQRILQAASNQWADAAASAPFGGQIETYYKTSRAALDLSFKDSLQASLADGAAWIGYFGHSGATTWEIVTDPPEQFDNGPRLPVAISLGCYNGAFGDRQTHPVFAEDVVVSSLNGAIAHWGGTSSSFIGPARAIADPVYDVVFEESERTLGAVFTRAKARYMSGNADIGTNLQYNLVGDPATRLQLPAAPDFLLTPSQITLDPFAPNLADSVLAVRATLRNQGLYPSDSVDVRLTHTPPDAPAAAYTRRTAPFGRTSTVTFEVPIAERMIGENRYRVEIDPDNRYTESSEANNVAEQTGFVFPTGLTLVYPAATSFITTRTPTLRVSLAADVGEVLPVAFELDTAPTFDSPNRRSFETTAALAADWPLDAPLDEGRIYYWRARVDNPDQPTLDWKQAAFTVRTDLDGAGWLQQGDLFAADTLGPYLRREGDAWTFAAQTKTVSVVYGGDVTIDGIPYFGDRLGWRAAVINGLEIKERGGNRDLSEAALADLERVVNAAEPGDIFVVRSNTTDVATFGTEIPERVRALFRPLGSTFIDTLSPGNHWVMVARVGLPESTREWVVPASAGGTLAFEDTFTFTRDQDRIVTPRIGPARAWHTLTWTGLVETPSARIAVDVLDASGNVLRSGALAAPDTSATIDLAGIDPRRHPHLRLRATVSDSLTLSTPQLRTWIVRFAPIPELLMDPARLRITPDTVAAGDPIAVGAAVTNLSDAPAGTVVVTYTVTDRSNVATVVDRDTLAAVPAFGSAETSAAFETEAFAGANRLSVRADQLGVPEAVTYNNLVDGSFFAIGDRTPPSYDVLVEGVSYPSDDRTVTDLDDLSIPFVPVRPTIEIHLADDNLTKPLDDTAFVALTLDERRLSFDRPDLRFEPATAEQPEARIVFTPDFSVDFFASDPDTVHTLRFWARDASGNANPTELEPYQVHFRIQTKGEVEPVYPYPNPMSTATTFAFRLRGEEAGQVEQFRIRIFTLAGQLVREFDLLGDPGLLEAGGLQIGWNKLAWDGTDADGDRLATGVYLYKTTVRMDGETVMDEIEKLVILR